MTALKAWIDANVVAGKKGQASRVTGNNVTEFAAKYSKLGAADGDGSILAFALLPADAVITSLKLNAAALAGFSSVSVGLYKLNIDGQTFSDTAKSDGTSASAILLALSDLSGGFAVGSEKDCLAAVPIGSLHLKLWELLGYTDVKNIEGGYVLALTAATSGTAAGDMCLKGKYIQG
jgi:hypothetical protein